MSFLERVDQSIRRSPVWRSIFRNPYPNDERSRAARGDEQRVPALPQCAVRQHAVKFAYTFCLGGLSFFLFLVLTVTGVYLMFFYIPSESQAYTNILEVQSTVVFGLLTGTSTAGRAPDGVLRVPAHDAGLLPRGLQAAARVQLGRGVVLLFLTIMLSFTGYLLPWDQIAYWAITIGSNNAGCHRWPTPSSCSSWAASRSARTAARFYVLHVMAFPVDRGGLPRRPLLAHPQGRRDQWSAMTEPPALELSGDDTKQPTEGRGSSWSARRTEIDKQRVPMSARPYRLLALVKQDAVVRVQKEPDDTVMTCRTCSRIEFWAAGLMSVFLLLMGLFINAPLEELAERQHHAGRGRRPWYFLGLQSSSPTSTRPSPASSRPRSCSSARRSSRTSTAAASLPSARASARRPSCCSPLFCVLGLFVTFVGIFFRGPGYSFVIPYLEFFSIGTPGLHFAL